MLDNMSITGSCQGCSSEWSTLNLVDGHQSAKMECSSECYTLHLVVGYQSGKMKADLLSIKGWRCGLLTSLLDGRTAHTFRRQLFIFLLS